MKSKQIKREEALARIDKSLYSASKMRRLGTGTLKEWLEATDKVFIATEEAIARNK
jgi:hypothetical protein